jgi:hypothetical protein
MHPARNRFLDMSTNHTLRRMGCQDIGPLVAEVAERIGSQATSSPRRRDYFQATSMSTVLGTGNTKNRRCRRDNNLRIVSGMDAVWVRMSSSEVGAATWSSCE